MTDALHSPDTPAEILVVDDEPDLRTLYELALLREGHNVSTAESLAEAREALARRHFDVVITDMRLPDGLGLELLRELCDARRPERSIVITAYGSAENAVEALKHGAFDYLTKPVDLKQFRTVVRAAQAAPGPSANPAPNAMSEATSGAERPASAPPPSGATIRSAPAPISAPISAPVSTPVSAPPTPAASSAVPAAATPDDAALTPGGRALARLVGDSPVMQTVKARIAKVARSMAPVLVQGESGTGKELVARAIHACSHRADGPFVPVNCGAIPENLLEAEFFGARKGAYTGAAQDRDGFFQAARGGTLFLDEIGDLPLSMQAKLLRAIQERCIRPLGETQEEPVDVRFVSATHKDLAAEVRAGRFRQDLYYRLNVIGIVVPPLRERRVDLPLLARALLARIAAETGLPVPDPSPRLLAQLQAAPLPGNVRELENMLHRAIALGGADGLDDLADPGGDAAAGLSTVPAAGSPPQTLAPTSSQPSGPSSSPAPQPASGALIPPWDALFAPRHAPATAQAGPEAASSPAAPAPQPRLPSDLIAWLDEQERRVLMQALESTHYNRTAAAARLGLNLRQIRYRMARLGIDLSCDGAEPADDEDGNARP